MIKEVAKAAIERILQRMSLETGDGPGAWDLVQAPICYLDMESYELLVKRTGRMGYSEFFTHAVQSLKPVVSFGQLTQVIAAVKKNRSNYRNKTVHTKMGKVEAKWVADTATAMDVRPSRVLEAVVFLYLRAEGEMPCRG